MDEFFCNQHKTAAIARFATTICHEFGNSILGLKYLLDNFARQENLSEDDQRLIGLGQQEIDLMRLLIARLGALYQPLVAPRQSCDLHELIEASLAGMEAVRAGQNIKLVRNLWWEKLVAPIIAEKIRFVIDQLIENAVEAMPNGGLLTVDTTAKDGYVLIAVGDTGHGLLPSDEQRLFEPFFSTKQNAARGFGLPASYHIMTEHQGDLRFQRNKTHGCVFTMVLPR